MESVKKMREIFDSQAEAAGETAEDLDEEEDAPFGTTFKEAA